MSGASRLVPHTLGARTQITSDGLPRAEQGRTAKPGVIIFPSPRRRRKLRRASLRPYNVDVIQSAPPDHDKEPGPQKAAAPGGARFRAPFFV